MKRREFITLLGGTAIAGIWPANVRAQSSDKPIIGFLSARSARESAHLVDAFRKGLAEYGLFEGQNATVDYSWADSHYERLPGQATDLVKRQLAVLVSVGGDMTAKAAVAATRTTPIVAVFIGDPVAGGFVASLSRPGANVTGVSNLNAVIEAKRLGLLREIKPGITTVGALINPDSLTAVSQQKDVEEAARTIGLRVKFLKARNDQELEAAFKFIVQERLPALLVPADAFFAASRDRLTELAARNAVPAIYSLREAAISGGLMSYGNDLSDTYRLIGTYAARIVKGEKPADLPVLQPTKFQFVLNLKTAKALGLAIPSGVLAIADEVIE
ncbi:MAG TPA: ABC transporter substrate-binding protein [Pseudolabrys sp.]|jgi:putative tryptophan/tyrosine transport system substrate-binding protein|nr:ABC transporter substrate-binding protein [Pseudolabrys sp.]